MKQTLILACVWACATVSLQAEGWKVSVKGQSRSGMEARLSGSSRAHDEAAGLLPGSSSDSGLDWDRGQRVSPGAVDLPDDDITTYDDRTFDNGFVNSSAISESGDPDYTWNWGYESDGQYDSGSQTYTFTRDTTVAASGGYMDRASGRQSERESWVTLDRDADDRADFDAAGAVLEASYAFKQMEWICGLGFAQADDLTLADQTYAAEVEQRNYRTYAEKSYEQLLSAGYQETYTYQDSYGVGSSLTAPYQGSYDGPGAVINSRPSTRDVAQAGTTANQSVLVSSDSGRGLTSVDRWAIHNEVEVDVETDITSAYTGLRTGMTVKELIRFYVQAQVSLNLVSASLDRREVLYSSKNGGSEQALATWTDASDDEEWVIGLGLSAGAEVNLGKTWFATASVGYEYMLNDPTFAVGPSEVQLDLSSLQADLGLGLRFH